MSQLRLVFSSSNAKSPSKRISFAVSKRQPAVSSICLRLHRKIEALHAANPEAVALVERLVDDMLAPVPFPCPPME